MLGSQFYTVMFVPIQLTADDEKQLFSLISSLENQIVWRIMTGFHLERYQMQKLLWTVLERRNLTRNAQVRFKRNVMIMCVYLTFCNRLRALVRSSMLRSVNGLWLTLSATLKFLLLFSMVNLSSASNRSIFSTSGYSGRMVLTSSAVRAATMHLVLAMTVAVRGMEYRMPISPKQEPLGNVA